MGNRSGATAVRRWATAVLVTWMSLAGNTSAAEVSFPSGKFENSDPDVKVSGQLFRPEGPGPHAAVVLLHSCGGMRQHVTDDWPRFLVDLGYVVLAVDTLGSRGYYRGCTAMKDRRMAQARDAYGSLDYLAGQSYVDSRRVAAVGFSMGANTINNAIMIRAPRAAGRPEFKAFASFYGFCREDMKPGVVRDAPLLQIIAEKDEPYAPSCIERSKSIPMEAHVLVGAYHSFDEPHATEKRPGAFGGPALYDLGMTEKARSLVRTFFATHLK